MATNLKQNNSDIVNLLMPYNRTSGQGVLVGSIFGVCLLTKASGEEGPVQLVGIATLPKATGAAWTQGQRLFWDDTNKQVDNTSTLDFCIGCAAVAAGTADTTGDVLLMRSTPIST